MTVISASDDKSDNLATTSNRNQYKGMCQCFVVEVLISLDNSGCISVSLSYKLIKIIHHC